MASELDFGAFEPLPEVEEKPAKKKRGRKLGTKNRKISSPPSFVALVDSTPARPVGLLTVAVSIIQMLKGYSQQERDNILDAVNRVLK